MVSRFMRQENFPDWMLAASHLYQENQKALQQSTPLAATSSQSSRTKRTDSINSTSARQMRQERPSQQPLVLALTSPKSQTQLTTDREKRGTLNHQDKPNLPIAAATHEKKPSVPITSRRRSSVSNGQINNNNGSSSNRNSQKDSFRIVNQYADMRIDSFDQVEAISAAREFESIRSHRSTTNNAINNSYSNINCYSAPNNQSRPSIQLNTLCDNPHSRRVSRQELIANITVDPQLFDQVYRQSPSMRQTSRQQLPVLDYNPTQDTQAAQIDQQPPLFSQILDPIELGEKENRIRKMSVSSSCSNTNRSMHNRNSSQSQYHHQPQQQYQQQHVSESQNRDSKLEMNQSQHNSKYTTYHSITQPMAPSENYSSVDEMANLLGRPYDARGSHRQMTRDGNSSSGAQSVRITTVSFGEKTNSDNQSTLLLKSLCFTRWVSFVCLARDHRIKAEHRQQMIQFAESYRMNRTKHKVFVLLRGFSELAKDRKAQVKSLVDKTNRKIKVKYMELLLVSYKISCMNAQQNQLADEQAKMATKRRAFLGFVSFFSRKKRILASLDTLTMPNRVAVDFIVSLAVTNSGLQGNSIRSIDSSLRGFAPEKAISTFQKHRQRFSLTKLRIDYMLAPHLEFLRREVKRRVFNGLLSTALEAVRARIEYQNKVKRIAFNTMKLKWRRKAIAQGYFNDKFSRKLEELLLRWREITIARGDMRVKVKSIRRHSNYTLAQKVFSLWHQKFAWSLVNRQERLKGEQIRDFLVQRKVLAALRLNAESRAISRAKNIVVFEKYFKALVKKAFEGMVKVTQRLKEHGTLLEQFHAYSREKSLVKVFRAWKRFNFNEKIMFHFIKIRLQTKGFASLQKAVALRSKLLLKVDEFIEKKETKAINTCFEGLKTNRENCRNQLVEAQQFHENQLKERVLSQLNGIMIDKNKKQTLADDFSSNKQQELIQKCLFNWRVRRQLAQKLKNFSVKKEERTLALCFQEIQVNQQKSISKRNLINSVTDNRNAKVTTSVFQAWRHQQDANRQSVTRMMSISSKHIAELKRDTLISWKERNTLVTRKLNVLHSIKQKQSARVLREVMAVWAFICQESNVSEELNARADEYREFVYRRRLLIGLRTNYLKQQHEKQMKKIAESQFKKTMFQRFLIGFYASIQDKKLKHISIRHYAINLQKRSFQLWMTVIQQTFQSHCLKVFDSTEIETDPQSKIQVAQFQTISYSDSKEQQQQQQLPMNSSNMHSVSMHSEELFNFSPEQLPFSPS